MKGQATKDAFYDLWIQQIRKGFKYEQAYNNAEIIHLKEFGDYRYKNYDSFRNSNKR